MLENPTTLKMRSIKYDNLKAFLILLVIFGHFLRPLITDNIGARIIYIFIFMFHMPAFIFLMGKFSRPKIKRLIYFSVIYLLFQVLYTPFLRCFYSENITMTFITPHWMLWYLFSIIIYSILSFILPQKLSAKKAMALVCASIAISLFAGCLSFIGDDFTLSRTLCFLPFFIAGKYEVIKETSKRASLGYGFLAIFLTFAYILGSKGNYIALWFKSCYELSRSTWYWRLFIICTAFCWIKFLISMFPNVKMPIISEVGKHTLFIYLAHGFIVKILIYYFLPKFSVILCFIASAIILLILFGISLGCSKLGKKVRSKKYQ